MSVDPLNSNNLPKAPLRNDGKRADVPIMSSGTGDYINKQNALMSRLSMKKWDVDPVKVYKLLTEKELDVDEYSGLVSKPS